MSNLPLYPPPWQDPTICPPLEVDTNVVPPRRIAPDIPAAAPFVWSTFPGPVMPSPDFACIAFDAVSITALLVNGKKYAAANGIGHTGCTAASFLDMSLYTCVDFKVEPCTESNTKSDAALVKDSMQVFVNGGTVEHITLDLTKNPSTQRSVYNWPSGGRGANVTKAKRNIDTCLAATNTKSGFWNARPGDPNALAMSTNPLVTQRGTSNYGKAAAVDTAKDAGMCISLPSLPAVVVWRPPTYIPSWQNQNDFVGHGTVVALPYTDTLPESYVVIATICVTGEIFQVYCGGPIYNFNLDHPHPDTYVELETEDECPPYRYKAYQSKYENGQTERTLLLTGLLYKKGSPLAGNPATKGFLNRERTALAWSDEDYTQSRQISVTYLGTNQMPPYNYQAVNPTNGCVLGNLTGCTTANTIATVGMASWNPDTNTLGYFADENCSPTTSFSGLRMFSFQSQGKDPEDPAILCPPFKYDIVDLDGNVHTNGGQGYMYIGGSPLSMKRATHGTCKQVDGKWEIVWCDEDYREIAQVRMTRIGQVPPFFYDIHHPTEECLIPRTKWWFASGATPSPRCVTPATSGIARWDRDVDKIIIVRHNEGLVHKYKNKKIVWQTLGVKTPSPEDIFGPDGTPAFTQGMQEPVGLFNDMQVSEDIAAGVKGEPSEPLARAMMDNMNEKIITDPTMMFPAPIQYTFQNDGPAADVAGITPIAADPPESEYANYDHIEDIPGIGLRMHYDSVAKELSFYSGGLKVQNGLIVESRVPYDDGVAKITVPVGGGGITGFQEVPLTIYARDGIYSGTILMKVADYLKTAYGSTDERLLLQVKPGTTRELGLDYGYLVGV